MRGLDGVFQGFQFCQERWLQEQVSLNSQTFRVRDFRRSDEVTKRKSLVDTAIPDIVVLRFKTDRDFKVSIGSNDVIQNLRRHEFRSALNYDLRRIR